MRIRTWLSRASLLGAALLMVLSLVTPSSSAQTDDQPLSFQATGFATPIQAMLNTEPQTFVSELVRVDVGHGVSRFGAGGDAAGRAASIFPGLGVSEGPALGWGQACGRGFPCQQFFPDGGFPPPWPLGAEAEHPTAAEASALVPGQQIGTPGGPLSARVLDVKATANPNGVTTTAVIGDLDFLPVAGSAGSLPGVGGTASPALIHVGKIHATTKLHFVGKVLTAEAESKLSKVSLAGGAVQIENLVARSVSRADGGDLLANEPSVTMTGVTVGGQPARITDEGIVLGDGACVLNAPQVGPLCPLPAIAASGVERLLESFGLTVRAIDAEDDRTEGTAAGDAVGIMVGFEVDATGFPGGPTVVGNLILGTAATSAFADDSGLDDLDIDFEDFDFEGEDIGFEEFADGGGFGGDFTDVAGETVESDGGLQAAPPTGPPAAAQPRFNPLELLSGVAADRIQLLYGAWTLALIGLALGSRTRLFSVATRR